MRIFKQNLKLQTTGNFITYSCRIYLNHSSVRSITTLLIATYLNNGLTGYRVFCLFSLSDNTS